MEVYLQLLRERGMIDEQMDAELRQEFLASGLLEEAGKYTLRATVGEANAAALRELFGAIADRMDSLVGRSGSRG